MWWQVYLQRARKFGKENMAASVADVLQRVYAQRICEDWSKKKGTGASRTRSSWKERCFLQFCRPVLVKVLFTKAIVLQKVLSMVHVRHASRDCRLPALKYSGTPLIRRYVQKCTQWRKWRIRRNFARLQDLREWEQDKGPTKSGEFGEPISAKMANSGKFRQI